MSLYFFCLTMAVFCSEPTQQMAEALYAIEDENNQ